VGVFVDPFTSGQMKKDSAKKLLKYWCKPVFLEVLKGLAKGLGLYLIAHYLK
jgi:hypothetical protein